MYAFGGVYMDLDFACLRPPAPLLEAAGNRSVLALARTLALPLALPLPLPLTLTLTDAVIGRSSAPPSPTIRGAEAWSRAAP